MHGLAEYGITDIKQHKPEINFMLFQLICSGVTLRRSALLLGCNYKTICKKAVALAKLAKQAHENALEGDTLKTTYMQFDEMQTFEHAAAKALTIALVVRPKTGQILSIKVG